MFRRFLIIPILGLFIASCEVPGGVTGPAPAPVTPNASSAPTVIAHAPELRFALVGRPTDVNVWALFDEEGASYANFALHSDEYPRLYRLSVPEREFEAYIADGEPSIVTREGDFLTATVKLQDGLLWSDRTPLTARDVAFTVDTALDFHLGFDWEAAYHPDVLDRAEAVDDTTVRFYFEGPFNVGDWQYGALQGSIVNQAYWSARLTGPAALLPSDDLIASLEKVQAEADVLQARINADNAQLLNTQPDSQTYNELSARITRNQNELNSLNSHLAKLQDEYDAALDAARAALFALDDNGEPTFGPFLHATQSGDTYTREADPSYPFEKPNFDRTAYQIFADETSALEASEENEIDVVLSPNGVSPENKTQANPTGSARFLVFNPGRTELADPVLRRALNVMIDRFVLGDQYLHQAVLPFGSFVLPDDTWLKSRPTDNTNLLAPSRIQEAMAMLVSAGYTWSQAPTEEQPGRGLILPNGKEFPQATLLVPSAEHDPGRARAAEYIGQQAQHLGIPLSVQFTDPETLRYAVYSSGDYDMAIIGYRLSAYPGYLCEWFQPPSPFAYGSDRLKSACEALNSTADLETARQAAYEVQSILFEDLPFIPLYETVIYDTYRNVTYPFNSMLDGLSGLYGAPSLAIPSQ